MLANDQCHARDISEWGYARHMAKWGREIVQHEAKGGKRHVGDRAAKWLCKRLYKLIVEYDTWMNTRLWPKWPPLEASLKTRSRDLFKILHRSLPRRYTRDSRGLFKPESLFSSHVRDPIKRLHTLKDLIFGHESTMNRSNLHPKCLLINSNDYLRYSLKDAIFQLLLSL